MSIESVSIALHHSRATGTAKLVLIGIANHDGDGGSWPAISTLQKYAGVDRRNVQRALTKLEDLGEIRKHVQHGGRPKSWDHLRPNLYEFLLTCPPQCDRSNKHEVANGVFELDHGAADFWSDRGGACDTPGAARAPRPPRGARAAQTILKEPSLNRPVYRDEPRSPMATESQKKYVEHMRSVIGDGDGFFDDDRIEEMTLADADGWISAWMGTYRAAGGGRKRA